MDKGRGNFNFIQNYIFPSEQQHYYQYYKYSNTPVSLAILQLLMHLEVQVCPVPPDG